MNNVTLLLETHINGHCVETYEVLHNGKTEYRTWADCGTMRVLTWTVDMAHKAHEMVVREYEREEQGNG